MFSPIENPATGVAVAGVAYAEANWGRWIARCPGPYCTNALALAPHQVLFRCEYRVGGCGMDSPITWPADPQAIETLLAMRPHPKLQNWAPGETLEELLSENAAHGCLPAEWLAVESRTLLLATAGGRAVGGLLNEQLEAAGRRQIGA